MEKLFLYLVIVLNSTAVLRGQTVVSGKYKYASNGIYEEIVLKDDRTFMYLHATYLNPIGGSGRWEIKNDSLILDSYKKNKHIHIQVDESEEKQKKRLYKFVVLPYSPSSMKYYTLQVITINNDTLTFNSLTNIVKVKTNEISAFFIQESVSKYQYPIYYIKNCKSNNFNITIKRERLFNQEVWKIADGKIQPILITKKIANFYLEKQ